MYQSPSQARLWLSNSKVTGFKSFSFPSRKTEHLHGLQVLTSEIEIRGQK